MGQFPVPGRTFGTPEFKELAAEAAEEYCACMAEARFGRAVPLLSDALLLAERVLAAYRRRKREAGGLDNDDLLVETARAFERLPGLAADYADRFQLVMVDEFQDTDQLQVDMIKRMAGPACERLCTVGDAQQSNLPLPWRRRFRVSPPRRRDAEGEPQRARPAARQLPQPCRRAGVRGPRLRAAPDVRVLVHVARSRARRVPRGAPVSGDRSAHRRADGHVPAPRRPCRAGLPRGRAGHSAPVRGAARRGACGGGHGAAAGLHHAGGRVCRGVAARGLPVLAC